MNPGTIRSCYMYTKDNKVSDHQEINESRYNKVVLHVHQRQSVVIGDK